MNQSWTLPSLEVVVGGGWCSGLVGTIWEVAGMILLLMSIMVVMMMVGVLRPGISNLAAIMIFSRFRIGGYKSLRAKESSKFYPRSKCKSCECTLCI